MKAEETAEGGRERLVLCGMLTMPEVAAFVAPRWSAPKFRSPWATLIGDWAVEAFQRSGKVLHRGVQAAYASWSARHGRRQEVELVEEFLAWMSAEWERDHDLPVATPDRLNHLAAELLDEAVVHAHLEKLTLHIANNDTRAALEAARAFNDATPASTSEFLDLNTEDGATLAVAKALAKDSAEPLFCYNRGIDKFIGADMARDRFVVFLAGEKSFKSMNLQDAAIRALEAGRRVIYFEAGDLGESGALSRLVSRAIRRPLETPEGWPYTYLRPSSITLREKSKLDDEDDQEEEDGGDSKFFAVSHEEVVAEELDQIEAQKQFDQFIRRRVRFRKSLFKFSAHSAGTLSMADIIAKCKALARLKDPWEADVVIIDYMDILAPMPGTERQDLRHQINETWMAARQLSQQHNCLVLSASQADAASYGRPYMTRKNFSNDKRILAHVSSMIGICGLDDELAKNVTRWNYVVRRHGPFVNNRVLFLAGCPAEVTPTYCAALKAVSV